MTKEDIKEYLKNNLELEIDEESTGFNGVTIFAKLKIEDEEICKTIVMNVKPDEG